MANTTRALRRGRGVRVIGVFAGAFVAAAVAATAFVGFGKASAYSAPEPLLAAKVAFADGKHALAEEFVRTHLARQPNDSQARLLLGRILLVRGRATQASEIFSALAKADPKDATALRGLAESYDALRQDDLACLTWQRVVHAQGDDATAWRGLALALCRRGDGMGALSAIQRAVALDPNGQSDLSALMTEIATGQAFGATNGQHQQFDGLYPRPNSRPPVGPDRPARSKAWEAADDLH